MLHDSIRACVEHWTRAIDVPKAGPLQSMTVHTILPRGAVCILLCRLSDAEGWDRAKSLHAIKMEQLHVRLVVLDARHEACLSCKQGLGHQQRC